MFCSTLTLIEASESKTHTHARRKIHTQPKAKAAIQKNNGRTTQHNSTPSENNGEREREQKSNVSMESGEATEK